MTTLAFDVFWRDRGATEGAKKFGKNVDEAHGHVKNLGHEGGRLIGAFAGFAAADIFKGFIDDARESNRISRITENVIKSTGGAAHISAGQVGDLSTAISNKTGADDEAIQSGANMLLTFTNVRNEVGKGNNIFDQATQATTDMTAAMNNGQVTSEGMKTASIQLGKALNDPIKGVTALQKVGVTFTQQQRDQIKALVQSGRTLDAQKIILGEVKKEFGGTAAAATDPMQKLSTIMQNLGEQVGNAVLPAMNDFSTWMGNTGAPLLSNFVTILGKTPPQAYAVAAGMVGIVGAAKSLNMVMKVSKDVHEAAATAFKILAWQAGKAAVAENLEAEASARGSKSSGAAGTAAASAGGKFGALATNLGAVGLAFGVIGGVVQGANWLSGLNAGTVDANKLAKSLGDVADIGKSADFRHLFQRAGIGNFTVDTQSSAEAMDKFANEASDAFGQGLLQKSERLLSLGTSAHEANSDIAKLDDSLMAMVKGGHANEAAASFDQLNKKLLASGFTQAEINRMLPQYTKVATASAAATQAYTASVNRAEEAQRAAYIAEHGSMVLIGNHKSQLLSLTGLLHGASGAQQTLTNRHQSAGDAAYAAALKERVLADANKDGSTTTAELNAYLKTEYNRLNALSDSTLTVRSADRSLRQSQVDLTDALKKNGRTLSDNTAKGRANGDALDTVARNTRDALKAHNDAGEPMRQFSKRVKDSTDRLADEANKAGMSKTAARKYAETILAVPRKQVTEYVAKNIIAARRAAQGLASDLRNIDSRSVKVHINGDGNFVQTFRTASGGVRSRIIRAAGGPVPGWMGVPGVDSVNALLMPDEHVWTTREVAAAGGHSAMFRMRKAALAGRIRYAAGGPVNRHAVTTYTGNLPGPDFGERMDLALGTVLGYINKGLGGGGGPVPGGSGVARWGPMVHRALAARGLPQGLWGNWMRQIATESGGNPHAVQGNIGDINNLTGDLAKGLLQVIGATFRAFHVRGTSNNVFDAWANMNAAMNYASHRYGSMIGAVVGHGHGYDLGGVMTGSGYFLKPTPKPERVLSPLQTQIFDRTFARLASTHGGGHMEVHVHLDGTMTGLEDRVVDVMTRAARRGRLDRVVRMATV